MAAPAALPAGTPPRPPTGGRKDAERPLSAFPRRTVGTRLADNKAHRPASHGCATRRRPILAARTARAWHVLVTGRNVAGTRRVPDSAHGVCGLHFQETLPHPVGQRFGDFPIPCSSPPPPSGFGSPRCYTQVGMGFAVPEGRSKVAQQFTAGKMGNAGMSRVPEGRLKTWIYHPFSRPYGTPCTISRSRYPAINRWATVKCPYGARTQRPIPICV